MLSSDNFNDHLFNNYFPTISRSKEFTVLGILSPKEICRLAGTNRAIETVGKEYQNETKLKGVYRTSAWKNSTKTCIKFFKNITENMDNYMLKLNLNKYCEIYEDCITFNFETIDTKNFIIVKQIIYKIQKQFIVFLDMLIKGISGQEILNFQRIMSNSRNEEIFMNFLKIFSKDYNSVKLDKNGYFLNKFDDSDEKKKIFFSKEVEIVKFAAFNFNETLSFIMI